MRPHEAIGSFVLTLRCLTGGRDTSEALMSDPTNHAIETTHMWDIDHSLAMCDLNEVSTAEVGVFKGKML